MADTFQNLYNSLGNSLVSPYAAQQLQNRPTLPQPIGRVYNLTTASEIYNIPAGNDTTIGVCLNEQVMYLKSYQNGYPVIVGYRVTPLEIANSTTQQAAAQQTDINLNELNGNIKDLMKKLDEIKTLKPQPKKEVEQWQV